VLLVDGRLLERNQSSRWYQASRAKRLRRWNQRDHPLGVVPRRRPA
jgi:hypothetical protein